MGRADLPDRDGAKSPAGAAGPRHAGEAALVAACARGEEAAWRQFVAQTGPLVRALARRMLMRRAGQAADADVDEIVADVYLALVRRERLLLVRFDPQYRLSTYLGVICRTEVGRHLRRGGRLPRAVEDLGHLEARPGDARPERGPLEAERTAALAGLRQALSELPERERTLLELRFLDGLDYRAIALALDVHAESVGQLLTRAKAKLRAAVPHLAHWLERPP